MKSIDLLCFLSGSKIFAGSEYDAHMKYEAYIELKLKADGFWQDPSEVS